ncbi:hypothetical protein CRUP_036157 [Coryphaenoides rupestris]|nr:hypothetical protein CRUP_036157 [Coryphaenoides rupestris]
MDVQQGDLDSTPEEDMCVGEEGSGGVGASEVKEEEEQQSGPGRSLFVTSRRGRKRSTKRKIADVEPAAAAADRRAVEQPLATAEEVPEESETPAPMESIDSYVQRKTKQMEALKTSVQDLKALSERTLPKPAEGKQPPLVKRSRASPRSPAAVPKPQRAGKASQRETADFRPSVLSTRRINVRFSEATLDNGPKKSLLKTPVRMSTPGRPASDKRSVTNVSTAKSPGAFVFTGDTTSFDLKASLSKPLSYRPHKGKLKPFGETKENNNNNSVVQSSHQKNYKQHQVQTREDRRVKQTQDRKQKKEGALGARRGLVMS